jgi:hypothetical protein
MDEKTTQVQFVDPFTVLVINAKGFMRQVYCPFRVICIQQVGHIPPNTWIYMDGVWEDKTNRLLYLVSGKLYPYYCFRLQILF